MYGMAAIVTVGAPRAGADTIGRQIGAGLTDLGAQVTLLPITREEGVSRQAFVAAESALGTIDLVVHAAVEPPSPVVLADVTENEWVAQAEYPLRQARRVLQEAYGLLRARGGHIVLVTPTVGLTGAAGLVPYATAVEGMRALAKSAARGWGMYNITVNCVAPPATGPISLTDPALGRSPEVRTDLAAVIAALTGRFVTGATIPVDGGVMMVP